MNLVHLQLSLVHFQSRSLRVTSEQKRWSKGICIIPCLLRSDCCAETYPTVHTHSTETPEACKHQFYMYYLDLPTRTHAIEQNQTGNLATYTNKEPTQLQPLNFDSKVKRVFP